MSSSNEAEFPKKSSGFENRGAEELVIDGPEDRTVRPCPPELLKALLAERERIARWQNWNESDEDVK